MSSQLFLGPTPIMENSSKPPLRLATALPETAPGMEGNLGSSAAPRRVAAPSTRRKKANHCFIPEILPHIDGEKLVVWSAEGHDIRLLRNSCQLMGLLNQTLTYGVNEVGVYGRPATGTNMDGDLSAMIGGVHQDVSQNVFHGAGPWFAQGIFVGDFFGKPVGRMQV